MVYERWHDEQSGVQRHLSPREKSRQQFLLVRKGEQWRREECGDAAERSENPVLSGEDLQLHAHG